jgi:hypothetical protein
MTVLGIAFKKRKENGRKKIEHHRGKNTRGDISFSSVLHVLILATSIEGIFEDRITNHIHIHTVVQRSAVQHKEGGSHWYL